MDRNIHAETARMLREERDRADREIARMQREYEQNLQNLREEEEAEILRYREETRQFIRDFTVRAEQDRARVAREMQEQEQRLQEQIARVRRETEEKIRRQQAEFERQRDLLYQEVQRKVEEVMAAIARIENSEQLLAEDCFRSLLSEANITGNDGNVITFRSDVYRQIIQPGVEHVRRMIEARNWASATGKALTIEVECKRCRMESGNAERIWTNRLRTVEEKLSELQQDLSLLENEDYEVRAAGRVLTGRLNKWVPELYNNLCETVRGFSQNLEGIAPGNHGALDTLDISMTDMIGRQVIEASVSRAVFRIQAAILARQLMAGLRNVTRGEWGYTPEGRLQETGDSGHFSIFMELINDHEEMIRAEVFVNAEALEHGRFELNLKLSIRGTRRDEVLRAKLAGILSELKDKVQEVDYGALAAGGSWDYEDLGGFLAKSVNFTPFLNPAREYAAPGVPADPRRSTNTEADGAEAENDRTDMKSDRTGKKETESEEF